MISLIFASFIVELLSQQPCNYNWTSWLNGPPCPSSLQTVPYSAFSADSGFVNALQTVNTLGSQYIAENHQYGLKLALSIIVVYDNVTILDSGFGTTTVNGTQVPTSKSIYNIGSVTKIFTSLMLEKLIQDGVVTGDDRLSKFYNVANPPQWNVRNPYNPGVAPTLQSLATQTSGLPREPPCGVYNNDSLCTESEIFQLLSQYYSISLTPHSQGHYSNLGIALLGRALARAVNTTYETWMVNFLTSIGMTSSGFDYTPAVIAQMPIGYTLCQGSVSPPYCQTPSIYNTVPFGWPAPCGGMYASPSDIAAFFSFLFQANNSKLLGNEAISKFYIPGYDAPDGISGFSADTWETVFSNGYRVLTKGGLVDGFATSIAMIPPLKLGIGVFVNFPNGGGMDSVSAQIINTLVPALVNSLSAHQTALPLPSDYLNVTGNYGIGSTIYLSINATSQTATTGYLYGSIFSYGPVVYQWTPEQDLQNGQSIRGFRFTMSASMSCLQHDETADWGIVFFNLTGLTVTIPDLHTFGLPYLP